MLGGAVVTVQGVEPLPERRLIDGGMQHLQRQRVAPGVLPVIQLRRPCSASAHGQSGAPVSGTGAHLRTPHPPAVVERGVNAVSRHQRAVLGLPRVGVEAGRAHPVSGRVAWRGGGGGVRVRRLRVAGEGGRRAGRGREGGLGNVGGAQELGHAGLVRRMKSRRVVGTCWRARRRVNAVTTGEVT